MFNKKFGLTPDQKLCKESNRKNMLNTFFYLIVIHNKAEYIYSIYMIMKICCAEFNKFKL